MFDYFLIFFYMLFTSLSYELYKLYKLCKLYGLCKLYELYKLCKLFE